MTQIMEYPSLEMFDQEVVLSVVTKAKYVRKITKQTVSYPLTKWMRTTPQALKINFFSQIPRLDYLDKTPWLINEIIIFFW